MWNGRSSDLNPPGRAACPRCHVAPKPVEDVILEAKGDRGRVVMKKHVQIYILDQE